jgi:hypothetical protein
LKLLLTFCRRHGAFSEPLNRQWSHDLHDKLESSKNGDLPPNAPSMPAMASADALKHPGAPNREFSFSNVLGNVTVNVSLPEGVAKKAISGLVKKHYVLLPTHRPPLRRDKPVRISIPAVEPSYRFPSTERSFIFIPRALRPNQQSYMRGRGRGSFHGSRRPSVFGGSTYTPSVAMSRKSSLGGVMRDTVRSPAGSNYGRPSGMGTDAMRPVVRLPGGGPPMAVPVGLPPTMIPTGFSHQYQPPLPNGSVSHGVHSTAIPMYQPRPQKTLSITNIESPAALSVKAPQQQEEQPFHQQVPAYAHPEDAARTQQTAPVNNNSGTPQTHISESAIYAQPFQPYPMMQGYYPAPFVSPGMMYPMPEPMQNTQWGNGVFPGMLPGQPVQAPQLAPAHNGLVAHEQNGMVYYADPAQSNQAQFPLAGQAPMMPMYGYYMAPNYYQA